MKKAAFIPLSLAIGFLATTSAIASTTVEISNNGERNNSNIKINNSVKIIGDSTNSNSKTRVKITTNGETKEYTTTGNEDINVESSDGTSKVQITNNNDSSVKNSTSSAISKDKKEEIKKKIKEKIAKIKENSGEDEIKIFEFFKDKWNFFSNILFFWRD